jgi:hypothetical protein
MSRIVASLSWWGVRPYAVLPQGTPGEGEEDDRR